MIVCISMFLPKRRDTMCNNRSDKDISLEYHSDINIGNANFQNKKQSHISTYIYSHHISSNVCTLNEGKYEHTTKPC